MKSFLLPLFIIFSFISYGQNGTPLNNCNNWLSTPSYGSAVDVGQLNVSGNQLTIEADIYQTAYNSTQSTIGSGDIVTKYTDPSNDNYLLRAEYASITTSNGFFQTPNVCPLELNKNYHIAMVYDGSTLKYYRNGYLMSQIAATGDLYQNTFDTRIGFYAYQYWDVQFLGYINEVRIWNVARTQSELRTYMNTSLPNPATEPGLLAYYTFDNLVNKQGNAAWNGTLAGAATINQTDPSCTFIADSCSVPVADSIIINDYTPVLGYDICKNILNVADGTKYNPGDTVLIIQMKGAVIDSTNTAAFGNITNYNNAGNYEMNIIKQKNGNSLTLLNVLQRQYDIPNGKVQLVRVPYYDNFTLNNPLTCLPWDGSKGGIVVLNVKNAATLNANIDVSGRGFSGGNSPNPNTTTLYCNYNDFEYPKGTQAAAAKGESITTIGDPIAWGKGAPANGGGGGNGHNSGGGGGSNGGAGGFGGYQLDACGGSATDNRGIGGKALTYSNANNKIFMGGGGGSGHTDNAGGSPMNGGNGGGIIIIQSPILNSNGYSINARGGDAPQCDLSPIDLCHDGSGGGGGAGTVLIESNNITNTTAVDVSGGKGGDLVIYNPPGASRIGPGGGGGAGVTWFNNAAVPSNIVVNNNGGINGVIILDNNNPYGTTPGQPGINLSNLKIPVDTILFKPNIDSVRIKDSATTCTGYNFKGLGYTNTSPISSWKWSFGDGGSDVQQNTSHTYTNSGTYSVKLIVTDINGCMDSITTNVSTSTSTFDFSYQQDVCNPLSVHFTNVGAGTLSPYWNFGDGNTLTGTLTPNHMYATPGNYVVQFSVQNGGCIDTLSKTISLSVIPANIIITPDTTICVNSSKQLHTVPSLNFCWSPTSYLDNPLSPNPITSTPHNITYYFTAQVEGTNLIVNGNFNNGNTGFSSAYSYANPNITEGQYYVGPSSQAWNGLMSNCMDHTTGNGNMMLVNGASVPDINVWKETIKVTPNTNYAFSTWIEALYPPNPAQLSFSINGSDVGNLITASLPTCTWSRFFTTWNSGNNDSATIAIVNKNTQVQGNDFALDDISFSAVLVERDSVKISIDTPFIKSTNDTTVCAGTSIQLQTSGASTYSWAPVTGLSNPSIGNPVATISNSITYYVTGINSFGCSAKDTVNLTALPQPTITKSNDTTICNSQSVQLYASGGINYIWSPAATLNNPNIPNPVASPSSTTSYAVTVTGTNGCNKTESVLVKVNPLPVFSISPNSSVCLKSGEQLIASGGDTYSWLPAAGLNDPNISNPIATPDASITYTVTIHDKTCNITGILTTDITVLPLPSISASSANEITCSIGSSQLNATGAISYTWSPSTGLNNGDISNPLASPANTTLYTVTGKDINGCTNTDTVSVIVDFSKDALYLMPNSFTPNGDGINDCFGIKYWGEVQNLDFSIYNRFGQRVFYTNDVTKCWDGTCNQQLQQPDVFVYVIRAKTACGIVNRKGTVTLLR